MIRKLSVSNAPKLFLSAVISAWLCMSASAAPVLQSVFDGKDLNGWGQKPAGSFRYNATDQCIQCSGSARGFCYTATKYSRYRVIYSVRQLNHSHNPTVLFFGFNTNLDAMGGIQFQLPYSSAWDYRPGKNDSPPSSIFTVYGSLPGKQPSNIWYRCEMIVDQTQGTSDSAAELLGGSATHIMRFHDSTVTNVPCPFAIQVHNSGIFDEYKDILIETNPPFTGLVLISLPAPGGLHATASGTQVNLSWTINSTSQTGFEVFHSTDNQNWTLVATVAANATSYSDSGLAGNSTYFYRVAAITTDAISDYATANATTGSGGNSDFSISATPPSQSLTPGQSTNFTVTIGATNGFNGTVTFSLSGTPSGASASFNPPSVTGSGTSTLTLTTSTSTAPGTYPLTITGTSGALVHSVTVDLIVTQPQDFSLTASPSSLTIAQSSSGSSTITIVPANGFNGSVSLSASGLPGGVTPVFNPPNTTSTSTLTLTASSTAATGSTTVTVTGTSGTLTHTTTIALTVTPASTNNFAGVFQIQNEASGLVLNNQGSLTNGSPITQWNSVSSTNLDWTFIATSNGYYQINSSKSGRDAVVQSASTANGAKIIQWSFGSSGDDQWKPVQNSDGSYTFFNLHSGLVLEDPGSSTNKTTQMDQWSSTGASNQKWNLLKQ